ncbi:MAG: type II secretion system protein [Elusimicrobiaceae bacterium]|nr:type II secretion system protein [Elusimicrobiaceae bacterium]
MKHTNIKPGFTLIELLVVILIIGMLTAVAVPQYQRAVQKAQFAKLRVLADSIGKTVQAYYLGNGNWPQSFDELDVALPADMSTIKRPLSYAVCANNEKMYCCIIQPCKNSNYGIIKCGIADYSLTSSYYFANDNGVPQVRHACIELITDSLCKTLPGATKTNTKTALTPEGWISNPKQVVYYIK